MTQKTCSVCGEIKPVTDFFFADKIRGYRFPYCKPCHTRKAAESRKKGLARRLAAKPAAPAVCTACGQPQAFSPAGRQQKCRPCKNASWEANKRAQGLDPAVERITYKKKARLAGFSRALKPGPDDVCEQCGEKETVRRGGKIMALNIDHCHETGAIRGFLCRRHNIGLGAFRDSIPELEAAIAYLRKYAQD